MNASRDTSTHTNILSYEPAPDGTLQRPRERATEQQQLHRCQEQNPCMHGLQQAL